jgi:RNA polymerase sigma-70 factor (ECF subfamily)
MEQVVLKQLFQQEFSKMVAVISKLYGLQHIETAEDIVGETFLAAAETWGLKGLPANPPAWLYAVAKQKTLYHFRRNRILDQKVIPELITRQAATEEMNDLDFSNENIRDSQLQMLFAVCNPAIASEAQIGLALRILCGFGIDEIAEAFLSNKETINKRLFRAKEKLRSGHIRLEMPPEQEIAPRLTNVLHVLYLLFSEGYYSKTQNGNLRKEFCVEALRLCLMLTAYEKTNLPVTNALVALMCFHASRFDARQSREDALILYEDQDENLWNMDLVSQGIHYLNLSAEGNEMTSYHIEARIAYWHCIKEDTVKKWEEILGLYDQLLEVNYSPGVVLNRMYALYKAKGHKVALAETEKLQMDNSHFYFLLLGELHRHADKEKAIENFQQAMQLARTQTEKEEIREKIDRLGQ